MKKLLALITASIFWFSQANAQFVQVPPFGAGQVPGTVTNDNPCTGCVGEVLTASAALGSVSLTTGTDATVTSRSLTAGDWLVYGYTYFIAGATTTITNLRSSVNTGTAISGAIGSFGAMTLGNLVVGNTYYNVVAVPPQRISLSGSTTYNLIANAAFGTSTLTAGGIIVAVRIR